MQRAITWLKNRFGPNQKPTAQDWVDLIDSFVHLSQQQAVDAQVVNQAINLAFSGLTSRNGDGIVNSLGDVIHVMAGYPESQNVAQRFATLANAARWLGLPGKPAQAPVRWTEQIISCGPNEFNPLVGGGASRRAWLLAEVGLVTGSAVILDIDIQRTFLGYMGTDTPTYQNGNKIDTILRLKIGVSPNVSLL